MRLLTIWALRFFYLLILAIGFLIIMWPGGAGSLTGTVVLTVLTVAGVIEFIIQALIRLEKWAWWSALLICTLLFFSLWFTFFGFFGLWGLLADQPRFEAARARLSNVEVSWKPAGVNISAAAQFLLGLMSLGAVMVNDPRIPRQIGQGTAFDAWVLWSFILVIGILSLCMACGVYLLKEWAWFGTLMTQGAALLGLVPFMLKGEGNLLFLVFFSLVAASYQLDPNVKNALRR